MYLYFIKHNDLQAGHELNAYSEEWHPVNHRGDFQRHAGFSFHLQVCSRSTQLWWQPESPWTSGNGSKLWPWWIWSFSTPGENCVLTAGKELLRISESYQLKKQFMRTARVSAWGMMAFWCRNNFHTQTELSQQQSLGALCLPAAQVPVFPSTTPFGHTLKLHAMSLTFSFIVGSFLLWSERNERLKWDN